MAVAISWSSVIIITHQHILLLPGGTTVLSELLYFCLPFQRAPPPPWSPLFSLLHCTPLQFPDRSDPIVQGQAK